MCKVHIGGMVGPGAAGDDEVIRFVAFAGAAFVFHFHGMIADETRLSRDDVHVVAIVEALALGGLLPDHRFRGFQKLRIGDIHRPHQAAQHRVVSVVGNLLHGVA